MNFKNYLILTLMALTAMSGWADATLEFATSTSDVAHAYKVRMCKYSGNDFWGSTGAPVSEADAGSFLFIKDTETDNRVKIYSIEAGQFVSYDPSNLPTGENKLSMVSSESEAKLFQFATCRRNNHDGYQFQMLNASNVAQARYINWTGGLTGSTVHTTWGIWSDSGSADDGSCWVLIESEINPVSFTYQYMIGDEQVGTQTITRGVGKTFPAPGLYGYSADIPSRVVADSDEGTTIAVNLTWDNSVFALNTPYRLGVRLGGGGTLSKYVKYTGTNAQNNASYTTSELATMWSFERVAGTFDKFKIYNYGAKRYLDTANGSTSTFTLGGTTYKLYEYTGANHQTANKDFGFINPNLETDVLGDHKSGNIGFWVSGNKTDAGSAFRVVEVDGSVVTDLLAKIDASTVGYPDKDNANNTAAIAALRALTPVTSGNYIEAMSAYNTVLNLRDCVVPKVGHVYSVRAFYRTDNSSRYVTDNNGSISAPTTMATDGSSYWVVSETGKLQNLKTNKYIGLNSSNLYLFDSGATFTFKPASIYGTLTITSGESLNSCINKSNGGFAHYSDGTLRNETDYSTDYIFEEVTDLTVPVTTLATTLETLASANTGQVGLPVASAKAALQTAIETARNASPKNYEVYATLKAAETTYRTAHVTLPANGYYRVKSVSLNKELTNREDAKWGGITYINDGGNTHEHYYYVEFNEETQQVTSMLHGLGVPAKKTPGTGRPGDSAVAVNAVPTAAGPVGKDGTSFVADQLWLANMNVNGGNGFTANNAAYNTTTNPYYVINWGNNDQDRGSNLWEFIPVEDMNFYKVTILGGDASTSVTYDVNGDGSNVQKAFNGGFFSAGTAITADYVKSHLSVNGTPNITYDSASKTFTVDYVTEVTYNVKDEQGNTIFSFTKEEAAGSAPYYATEEHTNELATERNFPSYVSVTTRPTGVISGDNKTFDIVTSADIPFKTDGSKYWMKADNGTPFKAVADYNVSTNNAHTNTLDYMWTFSGDWYNGYKVIDKNGNAIYAKSNATSTPVKSAAASGYSNLFDFVVTDQGYFEFKIKGTANTYLNKNSDKLGTWDAGQAYNGVGSKFTFTEVNYATYNLYDTTQDEAHKLVTLYGVQPATDAESVYKDGHGLMGNCNLPSYVTITSGNPTTFTPGATYDIVATAALPFVANNAGKRYVMKLNRQPAVYLTASTENNTVNETNVAPTAETPNTYQYAWLFEGDWYNGFTIKSEEKQGYYILANGDNANVTLVNSKDNANNIFTLEKQGNYYFFHVKGSHNRCLSDVGGYYSSPGNRQLKIWNSGSNYTDGGSQITIEAIEDVHYLVNYEYRWDGEVVGTESIASHRGDATPSPTAPEHHQIVSTTPAAVASVTVPASYVCVLKKEVKVVFDAESYNLRKGFTALQPTVNVVDYAGGHLLPTCTATATYHSANTGIVRLEGGNMVGVSVGTTQFVADNVDFNSEAAELYCTPADLSVFRANVTVSDGEMVAVIDNENIIMDLVDNGKYGTSATIGLKGQPSIGYTVSIEPEAALATTTITACPSSDHINTEISGDGKRVTLTLKSNAVATDGESLTLTFAAPGYGEATKTVTVKIVDNGKVVSFETALAAINNYNVGDKLSQYTYSEGNNQFNRDYVKFNGYAENLYNSTASELAAHVAEIQEYVAALPGKLTLNMPVPGKTLLRAKGNSGKYISGAVVPPASEVPMIDKATPANSILYYTQEGQLIGYVNGLGYSSTSHLCALRDPKNHQTFEAFGSVTSAPGKYVISSDYTGGGRFMYDNNTKLDRYGENTHANCAWTLEEVTELPVTIGATTYATLCSPVALIVPAGVEAYIDIKRDAPVAAISVVTLQKLSGLIPANTAVILKATAPGTYNFPVTKADEYMAEIGTWENNVVFEGTYPRLAADNSKYTLQQKTSGEGADVNFYPNGTTAELLPFHAFIPTDPAQASVRAFYLDFGNGELTGIDEILAGESEGPAFDLQGRAVDVRNMHGIYMQAGKKLIRR